MKRKMVKMKDAMTNKWKNELKNRIKWEGIYIYIEREREREREGEREMDRRRKIDWERHE